MDMAAVLVRKQTVKLRPDTRSDATVGRRVKAKLLTPPIYIMGLPYWPLRELEAIDRARLAGAGDDDIRKLVDQLVSERSACGDQTKTA